VGAAGKGYAVHLFAHLVLLFTFVRTVEQRTGLGKSARK